MKGVFRKNTIIPTGNDEHTSGILLVPEEGSRRIAVIVAHGAGNDMNTPLIVSFSEGLAKAGYPTLRFNFLYKDRGKKAPDRQETLVQTWQSAYRFAADTLGTDVDSWVAAGKSMGGRVASEMVSDGLLPVDRLILLGYPLHPSDNKEKLRDAHLRKIEIPMLFFAGTRDPLCNMEKLDGVLKQLRAPWDLRIIEGGDHSFHVPRGARIQDEEIFGQITAKTLEWLASPVS
ncbi:MAG: Alpha/beta hydrolase family protein [Syntrophorhabdus sp. PtaU1.Bin153]|nr:MAG: Alpha/beta hydrolase family protein [Syntrophorhabdus sp. PtaU1.Bin153]